MLQISIGEDSYDASCVLAFVLPHTLSGTALSSVLDPSLPSPLESSGAAHRSPPTSQATLPTRLPRLHPLVGCGVGTCACTSLPSGEKPPRTPQPAEPKYLPLS